MLSQRYVRTVGLCAIFPALLLGALCCAFFSACTQDDDGPLSLTMSDEEFEGKGFFRKAVLDSGALIHLASDTLYLTIDSLWTFSDCALRKIDVADSREGTALALMPEFLIVSDGEDCPSPFYRKDTTLKIIFGKEKLSGVEQIRVRNDEGRILDSILVRHGSFDRDTFSIYVDSLFDSVQEFPVRTKGSPSILRVLDSLTPRTFAWRSMESSCELRVDMCDSTVADTLYPSYWRMGDTALVPIRKKCADADSIYCGSNRWVNDSTKLGKVRERTDTLWHTSTYYVESIAECASMNSFAFSGFAVGSKVSVIRELMVPDESEEFCGPSAAKDLFIYDIGRNASFPDTLSAEDLRETWEKAKVIK